MDDDTEEFASLEAASFEFWSRACSNPYFPEVAHIPAEVGGPSMTVWKYDPRGERDPYPDYVIEFNRGGEVVITPA